MERILTKNLNNHIGKEVTLYGWVNGRRDHGKIIFIDIRDRSGLAQVVFIPQNEDAYKIGDDLRDEYVISISGIVNKRPSGMINPKIPSGEVEIEAKSATILSKSKTLPLNIHEDGYEINEELRWKYRYLDMRRTRVVNILKTRQQMKNLIRQFLNEKEFYEIDTPILTKSTPEGARDFLVPSRFYKGRFYALPQSPQQYKELLMVAGLEKYFQFPRCFRDEDLRRDRVFEFDQLDIEMSFVEVKDVLDLTEELVIKVTESLGKKIQDKPFPRLTYKEVMEKYGTEKPDLRKDKKDPDLLSYIWVVDRPLFEWKKEDKTWGPAHHPFTLPLEEDMKFFDNKDKLGDIRAKAYDLNLNGEEIFGGSIRITDPDLQIRVFETLGYSKEEIIERFGHLLESFTYGVPPHGGIANGFDRWLMIILNEPNIREVIPFPTTGTGRTAVMSAPSEVYPEQLKELGIKILKKE